MAQADLQKPIIKNQVRKKYSTRVYVKQLPVKYVFNYLLNVNRQRASWRSSCSLFHKVGTMAKKALQLVEDLWASLDVFTLKNFNWDDLVAYSKQ